MRYTDDKKSMELGELYRELRIARGLTLRDVARDGLSLSQLAKFENGQTMLSADRMMLAVEGIHMSFAEFGYALNNYQVGEFFKLGNKIVMLHAKQDIPGLQNLLEEYKDYESAEIYNRLNLLAIKSSIRSLDDSFVIEESDRAFLTQYLYEIEEWTEYELYIFGSTTNILSDNDLIFLGRSFVERDKLYRSIPTHRLLFQQTLLNLISVMLRRGQVNNASDFAEILKSSVIYQDMFVITNLGFFKRVIAYLQGEAPDIQEIQKYISIVEELGHTTIAELFRTKLQHYLPEPE